jgi:hypothetical protein
MRQGTMSFTGFQSPLELVGVGMNLALPDFSDDFHRGLKKLASKKAILRDSNRKPSYKYFIQKLSIVI